MYIHQYITNPELIQTLNPAQKTELFQQLQKYQNQLQQDKIKYQTQLELKQQEQQTLYKELQESTGIQTLPEIQKHIQDLQSQFDQELLLITQEFSKLQ